MGRKRQEAQKRTVRRQLVKKDQGGHSRQEGTKQKEESHSSLTTAKKSKKTQARLNNMREKGGGRC